MGYIEDLRKLTGPRPLVLANVAIGVLNNQGQVLLLRNSDGLWRVPGGYIELEESAEETARRKVFEKTGIRIGQLELVNVFSGKNHFVKLQNGDEFFPVTITYISKDIKKCPPLTPPNGSNEICFFDLKALPENLSPIIRTAIKQYTEFFPI